MTSRPALTLFLGALLLYNLNFRPSPSGDSVTAALLPLELVLHGRADFDACQPLLKQAYGGQTYFLHAKDGHYYSSYPVVQSLLLTPLYAPLALVPGARTWPALAEVLVARILEKLMASAIAAASVACLFLLLRRFLSERRALLLAAVYAFATNTWSSSSQALWQHGASQLTIVASLLCLARFLEDRSRWRAAAGAGLFAALSCAMRPTDLLFFAASLAVLSWRARRPLLLASYAGFGALIGGSLAFYNLRLFGNLRGGYAQPFNGAFWSGLAGLTVSPSHGLFVYSPVLLFALAGVYFCLRDGSTPGRVLWPIALLFTVSHVALCACWPSWWGGDCYGPRVLADVLPCLILLLSAALGWVARHRLLKGAFAATLVFSVGAQFIGAFCFPLGFHSPEPLWDWRHCPIVENARRGVRWAPYRVVAGWADDLRHSRMPDTAHTGLLIR
ncbi:MAG: glycosyltransferase family 39 protein [Bryobacteraceae bacterium]